VRESLARIYHGRVEEAPYLGLKVLVELLLGMIERREREKTPARVEVPMRLGNVKLSMQLDEQTAEVAGIFARTNDPRLFGNRMDFVLADNLDFGVDPGFAEEHPDLGYEGQVINAKSVSDLLDLEDNRSTILAPRQAVGKRNIRRWRVPMEKAGVERDGCDLCIPQQLQILGQAAEILGALLVPCEFGNTRDETRRRVWVQFLGWNSGEDPGKVGHPVESVGCAQDALDSGYHFFEWTSLETRHPLQQLFCAVEKCIDLRLASLTPAMLLDGIDDLLDCRSKVGFVLLPVACVRSPGSKAGEYAISAHNHHGIKDEVFGAIIDCHLVREQKAEYAFVRWDGPLVMLARRLKIFSRPPLMRARMSLPELGDSLLTATTTRSPRPPESSSTQVATTWDGLSEMPQR
jgi:hypothetical protein